MDTISGVIDHVIFHNADNGFTVLRIHSNQRNEDVTIVGHLASATAGEFVEASGSWVQNKDYGQQFKAEQLRTTPPHTLEGIEKYLGSGLIKGIGKRQAKKIVKRFGERTLQVIDESPAF